MARNEIAANPWRGQARRLPLKFHERAVLPSALTAGDTGPWEYVLEGGERVRFQWMRVCENAGGWADADFEKECQALYGIPFADVKAVWARRIGRLDDWWHIVKMIRIDA